MSLGICGQWRPRSDCASAQSDQGLHCPLPESLDSTECTNEEQRLNDTAHAQDDLNLPLFRVRRYCFAWRDPFDERSDEKGLYGSYGQKKSQIHAVRSLSWLFLDYSTTPPKYWSSYAWVSSVDPDQMPLWSASDLDLHCLQFIQRV